MKNIFFIILTAALMSGAYSCSKPAPAQLIEQAEAALAGNDAEGARACCNELSDMAGVTLSPSLLCRQALVFAHLAEGDDDLQDMASAAQCLERAMSINIDSVDQFYRQVDVECKAQLELVKALTSYSNHDY